MSHKYAEQLRAVQKRALAAAGRQTADSESVLTALEVAAGEVGAAWSGSPLGYHANVYYSGLATPPPGCHFSSEWGLMRASARGTSGDWREYPYDQVIRAICQAAGNPDLAPLETVSQDVANVFRNEQSRFESLTSAALSGVSDPYLESLLGQASQLRVPSVADGIRAQLPTGQLMSRDTAGMKHAPHQKVLAQAAVIRAPFVQCQELARLCSLAADHLELTVDQPRPRIVLSGTKVFIGHGRSLEWRKLKDFLQDRIGLEWDEFNRVAVAGVTNVGRLEAMLDDAAIAFLVMTAEDEQVDGALRARENVVHEAGLFQGRLGFMKAILMVEDTCEPFSNIDGLGQLRFPKGRIEAVFEEVRTVLEREGMVGSHEGP